MANVENIEKVAPPVNEDGKIFYDLMNESKVSVIKKTVREGLVAEVLEFLNEKFERARLIGSNEIGVVIGQAKDEDGFASDIVMTVRCTVKSWYNNPELARPVLKFDLDEGTDGTDGADAYEEDRAAKNAPKK